MNRENHKIVALNNISVEGTSNSRALSVNKIPNAISNLKIYPNPTKNKIKVLADKAIDRIVIYNLFGQKIYDKKTSSFSHKINLQPFSSGVYAITVYSENKKSTSKIIKQ
ncbi:MULTISPECIES: T9SS type A sorting domain-containing protein [unclassified Polaribacter]|uniref:T9SS type A sorting domain-containing protein n=1 Tax=unclassified Polaribacter TaxID=196858 RepID=UPI0011BECE50|nr:MULTISPECIES: T9SS type A sorting domain-containing protein [unclassified Polaribacter]TXD50813.1 T9SS type A sorting domain-containing protein [Polaribacter sp. IC063]TXD57531.1 T9SS type A sorting domain-containing protein [Polaribacter sp. IC066]